MRDTGHKAEDSSLRATWGFPRNKGQLYIMGGSEGVYRIFRVWGIVGFPTLRATFLMFCFSGSILGPPYFGKLPYVYCRCFS